MLNFVVSTSQSHQNWSIQPFHQAAIQKKIHVQKVTSFLPCLKLHSEISRTKITPHFHVHVPSEQNASKPPLFFSRHKNPSALPWFGAVGKSLLGREWRRWRMAWRRYQLGKLIFVWGCLGGKTCGKKFQSVWGYTWYILYSIYLFNLLCFISWTCCNISSVGLIVEAWFFKLDWICWTHYQSVFLGSWVYPNILMRFDHF